MLDHQILKLGLDCTMRRAGCTTVWTARSYCSTAERNPYWDSLTNDITNATLTWQYFGSPCSYQADSSGSTGKLPEVGGKYLREASEYRTSILKTHRSKKGSRTRCIAWGSHLSGLKSPAYYWIRDPIRCFQENNP